MKKCVKLIKPLSRSYVYHRLKSTLASMQRNGINDNLSLEKALPFSAVPSVPTVPLLKSMWVFLPVVGNQLFSNCYQIQV
jgi:hypothetical protein